MKAEVTAEFEKKFGPLGDGKVYFAPGRVNLIGEHTDYNGGHVFPCALTIGTYAAARKRSDRKLRFYSVNFPQNGVIETSLDDLVPDDAYGWTNYPKGVIYTFIKDGYLINEGLDMAVYGNIPNGSGLSSSASLEVLTGFILRDMYGFEISNQILAIIGQDSENNYNGMNCGIMDQFAVAMGKKDCAIFLDTSDLSYEYVPICMEGAKIVISNTNKKHELTSSAYNTRRCECEQALEELQRVTDIEHLCDLTDEQFEKYKDAIKDPVRQKRAKHAVYENQRTIEAVRVLKEGNLKRFGELMNEAHVSVSKDYEVSCEELDTLAEEAWNVDGCIGSRMTGGGFGGCTVSIVRDEAVDTFVKQVGEAYKKKIGYEASFYVVSIGDGPRVV
ncbi:MAG: galactokinase [Bilifractor sp.]